MSAKPDAWMPLYWGDYLRDTRHLTTEEHGAYLLLIGQYWVSGGDLADDDRRLAQIAGLPLGRWRKLRPTIAAFFQVSGGHWRQKRADLELQRAAEITNERSEAGKRGAAKRWQNDGMANGKRMAEPMANSMANAKQPAWQNDAPPQPPSPSSEPEAGSSEPPQVPRSPPIAAEPDDLLETPVDLDRTACGKAVQAWNRMADGCGLPRVQRLTDSRGRKLKARLAECGGLDGWNAALAKVQASPFLCGNNDRKWRADIDFMLRESRFTSLMEGKYDGPGPGGNPGKFKNGFAQLLAEELDQRGGGVDLPDGRPAGRAA